jgi:hypothetical protein
MGSLAMKGEETKQGQGEQGYSSDQDFSHARHRGRIAQEGRPTLVKMANANLCRVSGMYRDWVVFVRARRMVTPRGD